MGVHGAIKSSYVMLKDVFSSNGLRDYLWFIEQEVDTWGYWVSLPVRRRLWLWKHGFTSPNGKLYDFDTFGPDAYLSDLQRFRLFRSINGKHRYLLDDKLSQYWMLVDFPDNRPTAFGLVDRGFVHGVAGTTFDGGPAPISNWLPTALQRHSKLVLKQLRGSAGNQVIVCEYDDGFVFDGTRVSEETLCREVARCSNYLVSEYVDQHAYARELYPHASNTIRLLTVWDHDSGTLLHPAAVQRIGTDRSRPLDNFSRGGLTAAIDLETGTLGPAVQKPFAGHAPVYDRHPDTGSRIAGTSIPHWHELRRTVDRIARQNTNIPFIGWDVLLDDSGTPIVIEANTGTDVDLLQVHRPLLADPDVAAVVSKHLRDVDAPAGRASVAPLSTFGERARPRTETAASRNGNELPGRKVTDRESVERESVERGSAERGSAERDSADRESVERDSADRESAECDSVERDSAGRKLDERNVPHRSGPGN